MISKLKKKFIILATASMLLLMTVLVLIMNIVNYSAVTNESDTVLDMLADIGMMMTEDVIPQNKPDMAENFIPRGMSPEVPYESRYFTVTVDDSGEVTDSNLSRIISVDEGSLQKYISKAIKKGGERGFAEHFRYLKIFEGRKTKIIFLDCGRKLDSFYSFLWTSVGVGFFGCVVVFVAFLFAAGKIVKPIAESYEKQKRFISDAGHEIKTPLTIINANIDLLEGDEEKEELNEIRQQTKRLTELTNNLVLLSKMEEAEHTIQKLEMPISDIISETANSFNAPASGEGVKLITGIAPNVAFCGSPDSIRRLASILLENALKYVDKGGMVKVELTANKKNICFSVFNTTRETIKKEDLPFVFDRFYRTDTSRNSSTGGHGIGLSVAKAITDAHGGVITASTRTGNDFCVTVELPQ